MSLRALGAAGEVWLAALPDLLAGLAADWSITFGTRLDGGRAAYVTEATTRDGVPVVLKVAIPAADFDRQLAALQLAAGDPYARLIRHDSKRQALLLERLGPPLAALGRPPAHQLETLARTAARGWRPIDGHRQLPTGVDAARWHAHFIPSTWETLNRPCSEAAVDLAVRNAAALEAAFGPDRAVLVHGDAHAGNALRTGTGFRLVDPSGLLSEPAHDLGVIQARGVRDWLTELAAGDSHEASRAMADSCRHAGRITGVDAHAIQQWAHIELVSTGLHLLTLGDINEARTFLTLADKLAPAASAFFESSTTSPTRNTGITSPAPTAKTNQSSSAAEPTHPDNTLKSKRPGLSKRTTQPSPAPAASLPSSTANTNQPGPATEPTQSDNSLESRRPGPIAGVDLISGSNLPSSAAGAKPTGDRELPERARLYLMVGLPGAGKTFRAKELAAAHDALRLTPDEWMISLYDGTQPPSKRDLLEGRLIAVALRVLELGANVVLDFGLWSRDERSALRRLAASAGATCRVVYLPVDPDVQRARVARRQATAPHTTFPMTDADLHEWRKQFEPPDADELDAAAPIPAPPPGWIGWMEWAAHRWPSLDLR